MRAASPLLLALLGQLARPARGGAFPSGRGSCNLLAESAASCRGRLDQHCPQILERCRADADCRPAADCVAAHDVASMAEARSCFPKLPEGDALVLAECLAECLPQRQPPSCLGRDGRAVDWWFMYKLPAGLYYAYHDAEGDVEPDPSAHPPSPNASSGALGGTLAHVFAGKGDDGLAYVAYNDQPPDGATILGPPAPHDDKGAHAKGVLATDGQVGFWLVHSSPKLPDVRQGQYSFSGSIVNGQTYLCLSLSAAGVEQAAAQMTAAHAIVYGAQAPAALAPKLPHLAALARGTRGAVNSSHVTISTRGVGGNPTLSTTSFVKSPLFLENIYEVNTTACDRLVSLGCVFTVMALCCQAEVMPTLASLHGVEAMIWETWRRNPSILDSFCPPEHAMPSLNAINIGFPCRHNASGAGPGAHCSYHYTVDHAKWGISTPAQQPAAPLRRAGSGDPQIVCVGGINRMSSQQKRGGGTVCFVHPALHDQLRSLVVTTQECDVLPPGTPLKMLGARKSPRLRVGATVLDTPPPHTRGDKAHKSSDLAYGDSYQPYHMVLFSQFDMVAWGSCTGWPHLRPNRSAFEYHCADQLAHYACSVGPDVAALFKGPLVGALPEDNAPWAVDALRTATAAQATALITEHTSAVMVRAPHFFQPCTLKRL